ncbi:MAG: DNA internalization-related competence protein ComEC/Rec2 [Ignavibacteriae bacterium]|nr:DNA internalization-related competence protein ComEC/Rec2 [Ignavibacteriota bacterium]
MKNFSIHTIPSLLLAALFACGVIMGNLLHCPTPLLLVACCCTFILCVVLFVLERNSTAFLSSCLAVLILMMGALKIGIDTDFAFAMDHRKAVAVIGRIHDAVSVFENKTRFLIELEQAADIPVSRKPLVAVTLVRQQKDTVTPSLLHGSLLQLKGELYRPSEERNPGEFNSRVYCEAQGIRFLMRVRGHSNVSVIDSEYRCTPYDRLMREVILPTRLYILTMIDRTIGDAEGELLKGLLIGERSGIPYPTRVAFMNSGISHILAVSGSNVVVVVGFYMTLLGLFRFSRTIKMILVCVGVVCYMLLTGNQPPIVRATIMTIVVLGGKLLGERTNAFNSLGVAALLILLYDARQLYDVGFQLSFAAVFSIIYLYPITNSWISKLHGDALWRRAAIALLRVCAVSLVATLGTLPLTAVYFGRVSVVGILTNIFVIPLVGASVMLGFVTSLVGWISVWVAEVFSAVNRLLLKLILFIATWSGTRSWAYVDTLRFSPMLSVPFYAGLIVLFHLKNRIVLKKALLFLAISLNVVAFLPGSTPERTNGSLRVSFIDVGQGDASLIEFPNGQTMLIDAGMRNADYDAGERNVVPFLKRKGIAKLDYVVASHPDGDHIGGMPAVFRACEVKSVIDNGIATNDSLYRDYVEALQEEKCCQRVGRADSLVLDIGGARVYVLHPPEKVHHTNTPQLALSNNNESVVLKLCFGSTSFLLVGDTERQAEEEMLTRYGRFLQSTVLKVGHHGSKTSSSEEFLGVVRPSYAVVSVGLHNKFGHPSDDVIARLAAVGSTVLRTDEDGAIMFESDGTNLTRIEWR